MRIALSSPVRKRAFLSGCVIMLLLSWVLCVQAIVEHWLEKPATLKNTDRAARFQPLNAQHEENLGLLLMDPSLGDFGGAVVHLERAVAINPHSSQAWMKLAEAYDVLGDDSRRMDAVRHALASEPKDTQVQWEAANLFITVDLDRSLQLLRGVVENDPRYTSAAMQVAFRASDNNIDKSMLAVPPTTTSRLQMLRWLIDHDQSEAADRVWPTVLTAPGVLQARDVFFYLDSLLSRRQPAQAFRVWSELAQRDPSIRLRAQGSNLVTNGDFEGDLLNGGFGWRYVPTTGVTTTLDTTTFHSGTRSLAFQIDGENLFEFGLTELIPVEPGARYRLSCWFHGEDLEAAHGIRLAVVEAYTKSELLLSDEVLGSFPWREIDGDFTVPAGTQLVKIALARSPANGRIHGKLWMDDLRIEKQ